MLSSQMLWPISCSLAVAFMLKSSMGMSSLTLLICGSQVMHVVPQAVNGLGHVVLVRKRRKARGAEQEIRAARRRQPQPARADDAQDVTARECEHVAARRAHAGDCAVGAQADVRRRFAAGAAVAKELPSW